MALIGLYPGTFDPIHNGHLDIIERAAKMVDRLIVGVAINEGKGPLFTLEERVSIIQAELPFLKGAKKIEVQPFEGLLMHYANEVGAQIIIKGLRAVNDFEYEFQMTAMNHQLNPNIETVFLMTDPVFQAIASRLVKDIAQLGGDITPFMPKGVAKALVDKVGRG